MILSISEIELLRTSRCAQEWVNQQLRAYNVTLEVEYYYSPHNMTHNLKITMEWKMFVELVAKMFTESRMYTLESPTAWLLLDMEPTTDVEKMRPGMRRFERAMKEAHPDRKHVVDWLYHPEQGVWDIVVLFSDETPAPLANSTGESDNAKISNHQEQVSLSLDKAMEQASSTLLLRNAQPEHGGRDD